MRIFSKTFVDLSSPVVCTIEARTRLVDYCSMEILYRPEHKDVVTDSLSRANIPLTSIHISSVTIKTTFFNRRHMREALRALLHDGLIHETFAEHISSNFPDGRRGEGVLDLSIDNPERDALIEGVTRLAESAQRTNGPRGRHMSRPIDSLDQAITDNSSLIGSRRTTLESEVINYVSRATESFGLPTTDLYSLILTEETHRISNTDHQQFLAMHAALGMQSAIQAPLLLAQLMELNRLAGLDISSSSQQNQAPNTLSPGPNAKAIEELGFPAEDISKEYLCPLSLSIMSNPVYLLKDETKQRFERNWLTTWLRDKGTHPITRQPFNIPAIQEDTELKHSIDEFMQNIRSTISYGHLL